LESAAFHYICISVSLIGSLYAFLSHLSLFLLQLTEFTLVRVSSTFSFVIVPIAGKTSVWGTFLAVVARGLMAVKTRKRKRQKMLSM
jgi:hypothetical protein